MRLVLFSPSYVERGIRGDFVERSHYDPSLLAYCLYYLQIPFYCFLWLFAKCPIVNQFYETVSRCWSRGVIGFFLRGSYWKANLGSCGINVFIDQYASAFGMKNIYIGNDTHIDTNVLLLCASGKLKIGNYVHIASNVVINGKPFINIGDYTAIAAGAKIYGSTSRSNGKSFSPMSSNYMINTIEKGVEIGSYALVGINTVVLPGAKIGNYTCIGANSYVDKEIPDGVIAIGCPAKVVKNREVIE
jgi:acetyltransferase-like isoleucine patch superfamily enzyme